MNKYTFLTPAVALALPLFAGAGGGGGATQTITPELGFFDNLVTQIGTLINALLPVVIALGLLLFIWGLVQFIFSSGDEAAKDEGKRKMIWGVIALFVIVSVWGLVELLNQITGIEQGAGYADVQTGLPTTAP